MMFAYGEEELMQRQREQMHGNMRFLVELFKLKLVRGVLIRDCLEDLFQELNDCNVEVLCNMLDTLTEFCVNQSRERRVQEAENAKNQKKGAKQGKEKPKPNKDPIDLEYLDQCLQGMFKERQNRKFDSRVRFKI